MPQITEKRGAFGGAKAFLTEKGTKRVQLLYVHQTLIRMLLKFALIALCATLLQAVSLPAQDLSFPQLSPEQTVVQQLGLSKVTVKYARPSMRGRTVFGDMLPYGQVWRTGANAATLITFEHEVSLANNKLGAGTYALFTIPDAQQWTIILNSDTEQWGANKYDPEKDVLRFKVPVTNLVAPQETFTIGFEEVALFSAQLQLSWDRTAVRIPITVNQEAKLDADVVAAMKGEGKKPYFRAAMYYYNTGKDKQQVAEWLKLADEETPTLYYVKYWRSKVLMELGDHAQARTVAQAGLKLAEAANAPEYVRNIQAELAQLK